MSDAFSVSRRRFLATSITLAALPLLSSVPWLTRAPGRGTSATRVIAAELSGLVDARASARAVGEAYLALRLEERSADLLTESILADLASDVPWHALTTEQLRAFLVLRIQNDFARAMTVEIDGWMLSRTEARLCALVALT